MHSLSADHPIQLCNLNRHITCNICKGYLIDAVSITECLHSFCKSCIVKYLENHKRCPMCDILIHQSHPLNYISADRTLQDIVYKLVPNLKQNEKNARISFYRSLGRSPPPSEDLIQENVLVKTKSTTKPSVNLPPCNPSLHRNDEKIVICLLSGSACLEQLEFKFLQLSSKATVTLLRKHVADKVLHDISKFHEIDIYILNCESGTFLGRDHMLNFVRILYWKKDKPMPLQYRVSDKTV